MQHLDNLEIPKDNFIEFTSKGLTIILASTILSWDGRNQNERAQLVIKRICHSIGICSSQASKRLSRRCEDLVRNIFSNISHNATVCTNLLSFNRFVWLNLTKQNIWLPDKMAITMLLAPTLCSLLSWGDLWDGDWGLFFTFLFPSLIHPFSCSHPEV